MIVLTAWTWVAKALQRPRTVEIRGQVAALCHVPARSSAPWAPPSTKLMMNSVGPWSTTTASRSSGVNQTAIAVRLNKSASHRTPSSCGHDVLCCPSGRCGCRDRRESHRVPARGPPLRWPDRDVPRPGNPLIAPGAFGEKSVAEAADYAFRRVARRSRTIAWVGQRGDRRRGQPDGTGARHVVVARRHRRRRRRPTPSSWYGPEYDELASTALPVLDECPARALLLDPGSDRNGRYGAQDAYADTLAASILHGSGDAPHRRGTSLGALAHCCPRRRHPGMFDALFLQSGPSSPASSIPRSKTRGLRRGRRVRPRNA